MRETPHSVLELILGVHAATINIRELSVALLNAPLRVHDERREHLPLLRIAVQLKRLKVLLVADVVDGAVVLLPQVVEAAADEAAVGGRALALRVLDRLVLINLNAREEGLVEGPTVGVQNAIADERSVVLLAANALCVLLERHRALDLVHRRLRGHLILVAARAPEAILLQAARIGVKLHVANVGVKAVAKHILVVGFLGVGVACVLAAARDKLSLLALPHCEGVLRDLAVDVVHATRRSVTGGHL